MKLNEYIDHTNLKAFTVSEDILKLCKEAHEYGFKSVCVNPYYVSYAKEILKEMNSNVKVCTVIGFPLGQNTTKVKVEETKDAILNGAEEIDMVINVAALNEGKTDYVKEEIQQIRNACKGYILKVIIETCYLNDEQIKIATQICNETGADYIKTSTGFGTRGASIEDVRIMNENKTEKLQIKASGGIGDYETAVNMVENGATRLGTSRSLNICK